MDQQEIQTLLEYLNPVQPFNYMGLLRFSTLIAGLRDCRAYTKREISTGNYNPAIAHGDEGNWLAAIGYFSILDQIGSSYRPTHIPDPKGKINSIRFAIRCFEYDLINQNINELNALIALRNSFTHDFNLLNIPYPTVPPVQPHKFTVYSNPNDNLIVRLPPKQWNGDIDNKDFYDSSDTTYINLFAFGNMVESCYSRLVSMVSNNQIDLRIPYRRLINKYTFIISEHPIK